MERDRLSVEKFVGKVFGSATVNDIISNYRIAPERLQLMIIHTFKEMGIYVVSPQHHLFLHRFIVERLRTDPEIINMSNMAKMREATRTRSRHNE